MGAIEMGEKDTAKQRLIDVTIELICEGKKPADITVAEITERAGLGNGMVNYHFQSKDNLMRAAIKKVIICVKNSLPDKLKAYGNDCACKRLSFLLKQVADFFAENTEICKIAILDNLENDETTSHILSDVEVFNDCFKEIRRDNEARISMDNYMIASFLNFIFLKAEVIKKENHFDFYDKAQRDEALDHLVNNLYKHTS